MRKTGYYLISIVTPPGDEENEKSVVQYLDGLILNGEKVRGEIEVLGKLSSPPLGLEEKLKSLISIPIIVPFSLSLIKKEGETS